MRRDKQPARESNIRALVEYFKSGIKDNASAIGIELEHTLVRSDGSPVSYLDEFGQQWILSQLASEYDEEMRTSKDELIGLIRKNSSVTLEPAAQLELSAGPFDDLVEAKLHFDQFESKLKRIVSKHDIEILTPGYHPTRRAIDLKLIPKRRYEIMNEYLGAISMYGICMMRGSASTQVSIDYTSMEDCLRKMRLASACVPAFSLICDNSPIFEGAKRSHQLIRTEIWGKCDPDRCMLVPGVMNDEFSLDDYAAYILDTPACVEAKNGKDILSERTFGDIFAHTTMNQGDIEHALSMFFTDVRLKTYIEIRPADAMPVECAIGYAALIKGLFYDDASLDALDRLFEGVSAEDVRAAKASLMEHGYDGKIYGDSASAMADEMVSIAKAGLSAEELPLLEPIARLVANRTTLADIALKKIEG